MSRRADRKRPPGQAPAPWPPRRRPMTDGPRDRPPPGPPSARERLLRLLVFTLSTLVWLLLIAGVVQWWLG